MAKRWEQCVLEHVIKTLDASAMGGASIRSSRLDMRLFDGRPESHGVAAREIRETYELLKKSARDDGRLLAETPLLRSWGLRWDIYSPKLRRFIEVDESQHFSRVRLARLLRTRSAAWAPEYPAYFWKEVIPRRLAKPSRDLDPPHRDEQRAYLDELRDRLPLLYGCKRTIRVDEFTLKEKGLGAINELVAHI